jgi:hypothetical protein
VKVQSRLENSSEQRNQNRIGIAGFRDRDLTPGSSQIKKRVLSTDPQLSVSWL